MLGVDHYSHSSKDMLASEYATAMHTGHQKMIMPLLARRNDLLRKEAAEQRRLEAQFPRSIEGYRAMKHDDLQRRVARFLTSDRKDALLDKYGWAWRQTEPLIQEFDSNVRDSGNH